MHGMLKFAWHIVVDDSIKNEAKLCALQVRGLACADKFSPQPRGVKAIKEAPSGRAFADHRIRAEYRHTSSPYLMNPASKRMQRLEWWWRSKINKGASTGVSVRDQLKIRCQEIRKRIDNRESKPKSSDDSRSDDAGQLSTCTLEGDNEYGTRVEA
jgi:hypothetical protein